MSPSARWLLWALGLFVAVCLVDIVALGVCVRTANAMPVREGGALVTLLVGGYLLFGLLATALFWLRGKAMEPGIRTVATIAFLIAQGLLFAFMSMATWLGTNR